MLSNFLFVPSGNGYITTEQLREILWELDNTITASDMDNIIDEIDADDSGTVDFEGTLQARHGAAPHSARYCRRPEGRPPLVRSWPLARARGSRPIDGPLP